MTSPQSKEPIICQICGASFESLIGVHEHLGVDCAPGVSKEQEPDQYEFSDPTKEFVLADESKDPPLVSKGSEELDELLDALLLVYGVDPKYPNFSKEYTKAAIQELLSNKEREANGCPCLLVEPCSYACTCANPVMSGGCMRCARYGSMEQRLEAAQRIANVEVEARIDELTALQGSEIGTTLRRIQIRIDGRLKELTGVNHKRGGGE